MDVPDCCDVFSNNSNVVENLKKICTNFRSRNPTLLDKAGLGVSTFCAANHPFESCGSNGLPLTANSVQILGKFQSLSQLEHPNLCAYVEICRIQHGNIINNYGMELIWMIMFNLVLKQRELLLWLNITLLLCKHWSWKRKYLDWICKSI